MTSITAKITSKGQITLPKEVRELLGVGAGDSVRFEVEGGKITVYPQRPQRDFREMIGLLPRQDHQTAQDWQDEMRGEPDERATLREAPAHPKVRRLGHLVSAKEKQST